MTITVRAIFDNKDKEDRAKYSRLKKRLDDFYKIMQRSGVPWRVADERKTGKKIVVFYINEFYEDVVQDTLNFLEEDNDTWKEWFYKKYKLA